MSSWYTSAVPMARRGSLWGTLGGGTQARPHAAVPGPPPLGNPRSSARLGHTGRRARKGRGRGGFRLLPPGPPGRRPSQAGGSSARCARGGVRRVPRARAAP